MISEDRPRMFDTQNDSWVQLNQSSSSNLAGVQIGAFTLPIIERASGDNTVLSSSIPDKSSNESFDSLYDDPD